MGGGVGGGATHFSWHFVKFLKVLPLVPFLTRWQLYEELEMEQLYRTQHSEAPWLQ